VSRTPSQNRLKIGIAVGALALAGLGVFALWPAQQASTSTRSTTLAASAAAPAAQLEIPTNVPEAPPREPPTTPKVVAIDLEEAPAGLVVQLDGQPAGVPLTVPFGLATHELRLEAPGFKGELLHLDGTHDRTIVVNMQAMPRPPAKAKPRKQSTRKRDEGFSDP
jgi:hypothetical protein